MAQVDIIAEIGMNHDGSLGYARRHADAAADAGASTAKFQTHIAQAETLPNAPAPHYFSEESRWDYFTRTAWNREQWKSLKDHCERRGVRFLSSAFSLEAVELLESIGVDRYKVPSGEVTNLPLLRALAQTGKEIILSSGMSSWKELDAAVAEIIKGKGSLVVLQCTSQYPCPPERVGLNVMLEMRDRYKVAVGLSDHTLTNYASFAAVALGATVIEKHFTLSQLGYGSDAKHSLEPAAFKDLCQGIRAIEAAQSNPVKKDDLSPFSTMKQVFEKSLVANRDIRKGEIFSSENLGIKKPSGGLPPSAYDSFIGKKAVRDIAKDAFLTDSDRA